MPRTLRAMSRWCLVLWAWCWCACTIAPLDVSGRRCPCAAGYVCDSARDVCVSSAEAGAPDAHVEPDAYVDPVDANVDAGSVDVGTDAAVIDANPVDAGPLDPTACDDVFASRVFCSGFENASLSEWAGITMSGGGVGARSTGSPYRGLAAFHSQVSAPSARGEIAADFAAPFATGNVYVRFYAYVGPGAVSDRVEPVALTRIAGPNDGVFLQLGAAQTSVHIAAGVTVDRTTTADIPRGRWVCVQLSVALGASGNVKLSFGGSEVLAVNSIDTRVTNGYDRLRIGILDSSTINTSGEISVDEVVVDHSFIPCD